MNKLNYIKKVMDLVGETESKKHGYFKVLKLGQFKFSWDSWNGQYYLSNKSGDLMIDDYIDIIYKEVKDLYRLPSLLDLKIKDFIDLLDYLYIKDQNIKTFFDKLKKGK